MEMSGFRIATIRGIPIRIHFTFLLALPLIAFGFRRAFIAAAWLADVPPEQLSGSPWLWGLGVAIALFLSVLVHELAHSLYALQAGGRVRDITLLLIGGVSEIAEPPKQVRHEAIMALVGPVVSLALGGGLYLLHLVSGEMSFNLRFALFYLASLNLFLGIFNLLPAFPMDGGRILRSLLATRMGLVRATHIASQIGKVFAVAFGIWGFLSFNMLLILIAFFVFVGAEAETRAVMVKALLGRLRVKDVMKNQVFSVPADVSVHEAAERMLKERSLAYVVTDDGHSAGLLTLDAIQAVPPERRSQTLARSVAIQASPLSPSDEAVTALRIMSETDTPQIAVAEDGRLVGTVSREDIVRELKLTELESTQRQMPSRWTRRREMFT
ncbi:MAG: site-2 protease family protein [Myxococcota bacterium]